MTSLPKKGRKCKKSKALRKTILGASTPEVPLQASTSEVTLRASTSDVTLGASISEEILEATPEGGLGENSKKDPEESSKAMVATKEIAPYGDIMIEIPTSEGTARLKVASQVLCATSPVFRAMLGPSSSFMEACELRRNATSTEPYRLPLDDNPEALGVILLALHCQNTLVPKSVTFQNLIDLAIVCDKYDCAAGVSLWADTWTQPWKASATKAGYEHWLFVAWTFDIPEVFEELSKQIILQGHYSTEDPTLFVTKEGFCLDEMLVPEPIMAAIREQRGTTINTMSESTLSYQERYLTSWGNPLCKAAPQREACDASILGSIMKGFRSLGIATDFDKFILKGIEEMRDAIGELRIEFLNEYKPPQNDGYYCRSCRRYSDYSYLSDDSSGVNHQTTCGFLPELKARIAKAVDSVQGLKLSDFKLTKSKPTDATVASWNLFEYK